jgi:hypothetical protein
MHQVQIPLAVASPEILALYSQHNTQKAAQILHYFSLLMNVFCLGAKLEKK